MRCERETAACACDAMICNGCYDMQRMRCERKTARARALPFLCNGCVVNATMERNGSSFGTSCSNTLQTALENNARSPLALEEKQQIIRMPPQPVSPTQDQVNIYVYVN